MRARIRAFLAVLMASVMVLLPAVGSSSCFLVCGSNPVTNPVGTALGYFTQPSIDNLDSTLDARGKDLIALAGKELDRVLQARMGDLDKWSKLTIADASAQIKLAANDAENNLDDKLNQRIAQVQSALYDQQGVFRRNLYYSIALLQKSLLLVVGVAALLATGVVAGIHYFGRKRGVAVDLKRMAIVVGGILAVLVIAIEAGGWYLRWSTLKSERDELSKALSPDVRDFDLAAFRAQQIAMLVPVGAKDERNARREEQKYELIQTFFNQQHLLRGKDQQRDFIARLQAAIQARWESEKTVDRDLMATLAMAAFNSGYRTRQDEFIGAQLAATALTAHGESPLWASTFEKPAKAIVARYLERPLSDDELATLFPENAKNFLLEIPSARVFTVADGRRLVGDGADTFATQVRAHVLKTQALYFQVVAWNGATPGTGTGPRPGQQKVIDDINANEAEWAGILASKTADAASMTEKVKLLNLPFAVFARLADYRDALSANAINSADMPIAACRPATPRVPRDALRSPQTRSIDWRLAEPRNAANVSATVVKVLASDGSLSELSVFAMRRGEEATVTSGAEALYKAEREFMWAHRAPGHVDVDCDLLAADYTCPKRKEVRHVPTGIGGFPWGGGGAIAAISVDVDVPECLPDQARIVSTQNLVDDHLRSFIESSARMGLVACKDASCAQPRDYLPAFRVLQMRYPNLTFKDGAPSLYQTYASAQWVGTF